MIHRSLLVVLVLGIFGGGVALADEASLKQQLERLVRATPDEFDAVRKRTIKQLIADGNREHVVKMLTSKSPDMRFAAAVVMSEFPKQSAAERAALIKLLGDEEYSRRGAPVFLPAALAVGVSRPLPVEELRKQCQSTKWIQRQAALIACHRAEQAAAPLLNDAIKLLDDEEVEVVHTALGFMQTLGETALPARDKVIPLLKHKDFHTQYWAARALGAMGEKAAPAAPYLIDRLENGAASVRRNAALALGLIGPKAGEEAAKSLVKSLADPRVVVVEAAAEGLIGFKPYAKLADAALVKKLEYPAVEVKLAICKTLISYDLHQDECLYQLQKVLKGRDYPWDAAEILGSMGKEAAPAAPELIKSLENAVDPETRVAAAKALVAIGDKLGIEAVRKAAANDGQDAWIRETAAEALKSLEKKDASATEAKK